jgi:hypothetical protein
MGTSLHLGVEIRQRISIRTPRERNLGPQAENAGTAEGSSVTKGPGGQDRCLVRARAGSELAAGVPRALPVRARAGSELAAGVPRVLPRSRRRRPPERSILSYGGRAPKASLRLRRARARAWGARS